MFESLKYKYDDFCWWQIEDEHIKESLKKQMLNEVGKTSELFLIKNDLVVVAKSDRKDDVLFSDGDSFYVIHLTYNTHNYSGCPKFKALRKSELLDYMEWYYNNV